MWAVDGSTDAASGGTRERGSHAVDVDIAAESKLSPVDKIDFADVAAVVGVAELGDDGEVADAVAVLVACGDHLGAEVGQRIEAQPAITRQGAPDLPQIYCAPRGGCGALNEFQHEQPPCGVVVRRLEPVVYRGPNEIRQAVPPNRDFLNVDDDVEVDLVEPPLGDEIALQDDVAGIAISSPRCARPAPDLLCSAWRMRSPQRVPARTAALRRSCASS